VTGHDLRAREAFVARTEREQDAARQELAASAQQVEFSRGRLVEAGREREVLERLKRRRESEHNREIARREEQSLAEIALTAHLRNRSAA
jgi:flagellar export protein FliJ